MKNFSKIAVVFILSGAVLMGCGGNKSSDAEDKEGSEETSGLSDVVNGVKNLDNLSEGASKMEKLQNKLKGEKKLTNDELKAFFPDTFNGWKRTAYSGGNQAYGIDVAYAEATYEAGEKELQLTVTDGAGETGSGVVALAAMGLAMDSEEETEYEVTKNEDVNGNRASTKETKVQQEGDVVDSEISFVYKDRYFVKLEGDGFSLAELKDLVGKLNYSALK